MGRIQVSTAAAGPCLWRRLTGFLLTLLPAACLIVQVSSPAVAEELSVEQAAQQHAHQTTSDASSPQGTNGATVTRRSDNPARAPSSPSVRVALLGDDFFAGPGLSKAQTFKHALENALTANNLEGVVTDFSAAGMTAEDGARLIDRVVAAKPEIALVHLGYQDLLDKRRIKDIYSDLQTILRTLEKNNVHVVFYQAEVPDNLYQVFNYNIDLSDRYKANFEGAHRKLARMYPSYFQTSIGELLGGESYYLMPDKILPNQWGVRKAAGAAAVSIAKLHYYKDDKVMLHNMSYNAPKKVVVVGERLTTEFRQYADISFPSLLQTYFQQTRMKTNVSVLAMSHPKMDSEKIFKDLREVAAYRPAVVALQIGVNDIFYASADVIANNIASYIQTLKGAGIGVTLMGVKKIAGLERLKTKRVGKFLNMYSFLGKKLGVPVVPDLLKNISGYKEGQNSNTVLSRDAMMEVVRTAAPYIERSIIASELEDRNKARTEPLQ